MTLSQPGIAQLFFILIRLGTVLLLTPIQAIRQLPIQIRLLFVFTLGFLYVGTFAPLPQTLSNERLLLGGVSELANGLILATSLQAVFATFQIAGQLIDSQTGTNALALFNPAEHTQEPLTSRLFSMLGVLFFFAIDGHLWLFKGLSYSFVLMQPGELSLFAGFLPVIKQFGFMYSLAFMLASPIILALVTIDLAGGVITRNMPQVNTYFLTLPLKITMGLLLLMLMLTHFKPLASLLFEQCFHTWQEVLS